MQRGEGWEGDTRGEGGAAESWVACANMRRAGLRPRRVRHVRPYSRVTAPSSNCRDAAAAEPAQQLEGEAARFEDGGGRGVRGGG